MTPAMRSALRLPSLSAMYEATKAPTKQPHCNVETMLACKLALSMDVALSRLYLLAKRVSSYIK